MINNGITSNTIIAGELTVTEVTVNDNGTRYRCQPNNSTLISSVATLTVLRKFVCLYIICNCCKLFLIFYNLFMENITDEANGMKIIMDLLSDLWLFNLYS